MGSSACLVLLEKIKATPHYEDIILGTVHIQTFFPILVFFYPDSTKIYQIYILWIK